MARSSVRAGGVRWWTIYYRAHNGVRRPAIVIAPSELGPLHPASRPLPLVISPHGRGVRPKGNAPFWGGLPALGRFAVVCPGGMGRRLPLHSWGYHRQIDDLARMPRIVTNALPWLRVDPRRIYAVGGSMGGQETLLLLGQHPRLLKGAVAFDSVTNFYSRYEDFRTIRNGRTLQALARLEVGGTPRSNPTGYVLRSPTHWVEQVARSGVPLQIWWSTADAIVVDQLHQSASFFTRIKQIRRDAPVEAVIGKWRHSSEQRATTQLPKAIAWLGLLEL